MNNTGGQDDFQIGQTAKARSGSPCAVTPQSDMTASASQGSVRRVFRVSKKFHPLIAAKTHIIAISLRGIYFKRVRRICLQNRSITRCP